MTASQSSRPFSVLMSVYDREQPQFLHESLASLEKSIVPVPELVLVEDGPLRDGLRAVIDRHRDSLPIVSVRLDANQGLPAALNAGLRHCRHEYVARFDSDDLIVPHRFQVQLDFLDRHPHVCAVGSTIEEFDAVDGRTLGRRLLPIEPSELRAFAKTRNPMNHPSVMYRRSVVQAVGGYGNFLYFEDYALWVHCLVRGHALANVPDTLVRMRSGHGQISRRRGWRYTFNEARLAGEFRRIGFFSHLEWLRFVLTRLPLRLLPSTLLSRIYRRQLREPIRTD